MRIAPLSISPIRFGQQQQVNLKQIRADLEKITETSLENPQDLKAAIETAATFTSNDKYNQALKQLNQEG